MTREDLPTNLRYDPSTGLFFWRSKDKKRSKEDWLAGGKDKLGYVSIRIRGRGYYAHHLAWLLVYGTMPAYLDHKDLNPSNNRIDNLRIATHQQNCLNRSLRSDSQTGFKGVKRCPYGKFMVRIMIGEKRKYLGLYDQAEEAAKVYDAAARIHHGEFARLNFPDQPCA